MQRETWRQNETRNGVDPVTGQPLVALYLQQFDGAWPEGRIGEWVQHFRPDVFAEAKAIWDREAHGTWNLRVMWKEEKSKAEAQVQAERRAESDQDKGKD